ncbi:hypothetical protein [Streptomyces sp. NPDC057557]|uniref:hypothetical protein n=1 Tax=Streptomyces sp. NPDC057557 TaxID=3346167 RepID=UPI0036BAD9DF
MSDIKVGDRVRVIREFQHTAGNNYYSGRTGTVTEVDTCDPSLPYNVRLDEADGTELWVYSVERIAPEPMPMDRDALVARAKEHLAGTTHTADDIIRLAEFLAG